MKQGKDKISTLAKIQKKINKSDQQVKSWLVLYNFRQSEQFANWCKFLALNYNKSSKLSKNNVK